jgi:hypothetical protein
MEGVLGAENRLEMSQQQLVKTDASGPTRNRTGNLPLPVLGAIIVSIDYLLFHLYDWAKVHWLGALQREGHLLYWRFFTLGLFGIGYTALVLTTSILARKSASGKIAPPLKSILIDLAMTAALWWLGLSFETPPGRDYLASVGLLYLPSSLFLIGAAWFVIGILRLRLLTGARTG